MKTVGILLAAGHSRRFGPENKLLANFKGRPLIEHSALALLRANIDHLIAVVASTELKARLDGFDCVSVENANHTQSESLHKGICRAAEVSADRVIIALADMPLVTPNLLNKVLARSGVAGISAASDGRRRMPPACFPKTSFPALLALTGDQGAGALLKEMPETQFIRVPSDLLVDIDTPADLGGIAK